MKLLSPDLELSLLSCSVQALQVVEVEYVQEHWSCVSRCLYSVPACVLVYSVCCLWVMLNNVLRACKDTVHIMVQLLSAVFVLRRRWYELCCRSESSLAPAHCLQIVMGLYGLTHAKTVGVCSQLGKTQKDFFFLYYRCLINEFHERTQQKTFLCSNAPFPALMKVTLGHGMNHRLLFSWRQRFTQCDSFTSSTCKPRSHYVLWGPMLVIPRDWIKQWGRCSTHVN